MAVEVAGTPAQGRQPGALDAAIVQTVLYSDLFDQPLRPVEVHRYLPIRASGAEVDDVFASQPSVSGRLEWQAGLVHLAGRAQLVPLRRRRELLARERWPQARRYGRAIAALPFVRLVGITGALAVDNVDLDDDVDFFIATSPGRLWLTRAFILAVVVAARRRGLELCPNYLLAETAFAQPERGPYAAREVVQMVPIYGRASYQRFRAANAWVQYELPNADPDHLPPDLDDLGPLQRWKHTAERLLGGALGDQLERFERKRKIRKLGARQGGDRSVFDAERCKGHFEGHGTRVLEAFQLRLREYGLEAHEAP